MIQAGDGCYDEVSISHAGTEGGGIWTILKSTYNLTVWFEGELVVQYPYSSACSLHDTAFGISFRDTDDWTDSASVAYRLDISDPPSLPPTTYTCQSPDDLMGLNYRGTHNTSEDGFTCQAWDVHSPNRHSSYTAEKYPGAGLDGNYCRNPDGEDDGPWCYNAEGSSPRWAYCYVPRCESSYGSCVLESTEFESSNFKSFTTSDKNVTECEETCLRWAKCEAWTYRPSDGKCWLYDEGVQDTEYSDLTYMSGRASCHTEAARYQVSDYVNVALLPNVTVEQIGSTWGGSASRAVNENRNTDWARGGCSFTSGGNRQYWQIDLLKSYQIDHIIIYGRSDDDYAGGLNGAKLIIGGQVCEEISGMDLSPTQGHTFDCNGEADRRVGRIVEIEMWDEKVSICEIEIMVHADLLDAASQPTPDPSNELGEVVGDYLNVAYKKEVSESAVAWGGVSSRAVDGWVEQDWDDASCSCTDDNSLPDYWSVDLGRNYQIDNIKVWGRADGGTSRNEGAMVWVDENICGRLTDNNGEARADVITCDQDMMAGRTVKITKNKAHICLCEVQVMVRQQDISFEPSPITWPGEKGEEYTNVALEPFVTATQSSTLHSGDARRAIDGDTNGEWSSGSVTHTNKDGNSWWEVDLGRVYKIDHITVYGRTDSNSERIDGARVVVGGDIVAYLETPAVATDAMNVTLDADTYAQKVRVELLHEYLSLAEVQVYVANGDVMSDEVPTEQARWENVAINRPTNESSTPSNGGSPSRGVDNYPNSTVWSHGSCTYTDDGALNWWEVDLEQAYYIDHILVSGRSDNNMFRLDYATITIDDRTVANFGDFGEQVYFTFPLNGYRGQVVRVWNRDEHLTVCEVQVMVDHDYVPDASSVEPFYSSAPNLAYDSAAQVSASSSWYDSGDAPGPERAVDGNIDADIYGGSCWMSAPDQGDSWLKVELGAEKSVASVAVYPRLDKEQSNIDGAVVRVGEHVCGTIVYEAGSLYYELDCGPATGSDVTVSKLGWLQICEIVIHG